MKKLIATVAVAATLGAGLTACGSDDDSASGGTQITFGYIGDFNGTSLLAVAEEQGLWEKAGLDVDTKVFTDGPTQITALGAGSLDYGYIGPGAVWLPASGQAKIIAVNTLGGADRVIAQPGIDSIEDLEGKKVAVPEGTSGDMILGLALDAAGMTRDDVDLVPMDPPTIVSAFSAGQVDAAGIFYPSIDTIKQQVPDLVELAQNSDFSDDFAFPTAFVAGNDVDAGTNAEVVAVLREAMDYRADHMDEAIAATAEMLDQPVDAVERDASHNEVMTADELDGLTEDGTVDGWFTALQDFFVTAGKIDEPVDPSTFYLGDDFVAAGK
ncbi:aliphatic sulfonate ABC transporter substrate-binding protein [Nocardioides oleivorans]|uniref:Aliphatic sulfonate ABC transporter substrate-binding protein n=1 Tax=Nocardioides oleivorans TaxID=273676 RepID=A0A4Q2RUS8_9ACTN|nr:aliphatic sulfonate ABC transporter substrate-binding protein [Nocardioides oleivorans]RYB91734.1 aliphatic sulfonate ABC transporter substrate-binding protein [Nocardioides oleivorans]